MKKIIAIILVAMISFTTSFVDVTANTEVQTEEELLKEESLDIELDKMQAVYDNHYLIDCDSKESKMSFEDDKDLKELYKETCKDLRKNDEEEYSSVTHINPQIDLVSSFMDYDLPHDLFYTEIFDKINEDNLTDQDLNILQLGKFYFDNNFEIHTLVVDEIDSILNPAEPMIMLMSATYGSWTEYSRTINYAKQWASSSLYNVDKVYEKRYVQDYTDWVATAVTTCLFPAPSGSEYVKYVKTSSCGFLNAGGMYTKYTRQDNNYYEYRTLYERTNKVDSLPSFDISADDKFHLTKNLYYDYLMQPYLYDLNGAEVDLYLNYTRYESEQDNFITSKSSGAYSGDSEQTLKIRGKITGNYIGSRYAYRYHDFEFRDGRVISCSNSTCFSSTYLNNLDDEFWDPWAFVSAEKVFHTLIVNYLFYGEYLGNLYIPTDNYPYSYYGGYLEYNDTWLEYVGMVDSYAKYTSLDRKLEMREHFFRNLLQKDHFPSNLDDFIELNASLIPSQRWGVYDVVDSIYHMNDFDRSQGGAISESEKGVYNIKLYSFNKSFELVYSTYYGTLLDEETDWVNMGTYNYDGNSDIHHLSLDIVPYKDFGNNGRDNADGQWSIIVEGYQKFITGLENHPIYIEWESNSNAYDKYYYYKDLIE